MVKSIKDAQELIKFNLLAITNLEKENENLIIYVNEQLQIAANIKKEELFNKKDTWLSYASSDFRSLVLQRDGELRRLKIILLREVSDVFNLGTQALSLLYKHNIRFVWQLVSLDSKTLHSLLKPRSLQYIEYSLSENGLFWGMDVVKILFGNLDLEKELKPQYTFDEETRTLTPEIHRNIED